MKYSALYFAFAATFQSVDAFASPRKSIASLTRLKQQVTSQDTPDGRVVEADRKEIKCAFFRAINPRTNTYKEFREDLDAGGLDPELTDIFGWPMIFLQQGPIKALLFGRGLDTLDLDGWVDGVLSHKDLMWPYRSEVAAFLKKKADRKGQISVMDLWEAKRFTTDKYNIETVTFASYNEIPLIFLRNGGNTDTGKVDLKNVLAFLDGENPGTLGRVTKEGLEKVGTMLPAPKPSLLSSPDKFQLVIWLVATVASVVKTTVSGLFKKS